MAQPPEPVRGDAAGRPPAIRRRLLAAALAMVVVVGAVAGGLAVTRPWATAPACPPAAVHPEWSVARRWDEAALDAIRRALPAPTVHARNLFHLSVAMWDAWAAYDPDALGYVVTEKASADDPEAARSEAMSYAAYRLLSARYITSVGGSESLTQFADTMDALCLPLDVTTTDGGSPAALGNRIAAAILQQALLDHANEGGGYAADGYAPVNGPLVVNRSGTEMADPNRWQPLQLEKMISQNGIPVENGVQQAIGPHWGHVRGFALPSDTGAGTPIDPGPPPRLGDPATDAVYREQAVEVITLSSRLDAASGRTLDISPAGLGNNPLGSNEGTGRDVNPATGQPYAPEIVAEGDYGRALAEFWADGPKSETPPGHWNVIANEVSDALDPDLRIAGAGDPVGRLEWDVKLYFALNGAVHDAAIAAWGLKGHYDSARPISMIRYLGGLGQSSDPAQPAYDQAGLPLVPDLIEVVSQATTAPGARHEALAGHEGEIAIRAWAGSPADPATETPGVAWILAVDWVPYQQPTFVTPAFQGYVSGHSTFSRAAAEVMTAFTGSDLFPGGLGTHVVEAGALAFEEGPSETIVLQWATYHDAADQAGRSRIWGGIHITADDLAGRVVGSQCGIAAWDLAQRYYRGTAGS